MDITVMNFRGINNRLVGEEGLEPSLYCYNQILSLVNGSIMDYFTALLLVFNWGLR